MSTDRRSVLNAATDRLAAAGIDTARLDSELLLAHVLGTDRLQLILDLDASTAPDDRAAFDRMLARRAARIPLAHISGVGAFWDMDLGVSPETLIPRPDSEILIEAALARTKSVGRLLDLGVGSGALMLALLREWPEARGVGVDISSAALKVARANAKRVGVADRCRFLEGDWFKALAGREGRFDVIVANPPYIRADDFDNLMPEVRDHEPRLALVGGGKDGLDAYRCITLGAPAHLVRGGLILLEVGYDQADAVAAMLLQAGLCNIDRHTDLGGHSRVLSAFTV